jgi:hypothetical protein
VEAINRIKAFMLYLITGCCGSQEGFLRLEKNKMFNVDFASLKQK